MICLRSSLERSAPSMLTPWNLSSLSVGVARVAETTSPLESGLSAQASLFHFGEERTCSCRRGSSSSTP